MRITVVALLALSGCNKEAPNAGSISREGKPGTGLIGDPRDLDSPNTGSASRKAENIAGSLEDKVPTGTGASGGKPKRAVRFAEGRKEKLFEKSISKLDHERRVIVPDIDRETSKKALEFHNSLRIDPSSRVHVSLSECATTSFVVDGHPCTFDGATAVRSDGESRYLVNLAIRTGANEIGIRLQEWLHKSILSRDIVGVQRAEFPGKTRACTKFFPFEDVYGRKLSEMNPDDVPIKQVFELAARGLQVLRDLHSVGLVHGALRDGLVWVPNNVASLKLRMFDAAKFYLDPNTGLHHSVSTCNWRELSAATCPSTFVDLEAFARITMQLIDERGGSGLVRLFAEAVEDLGYAEAFDYEDWISKLSSAAGSIKTK